MSAVDTWGTDQVNDFIVQLGLNYDLKPAGMDGEGLISANHTVLKDLGISIVGHRIKLLNAIYQKKKENLVRFKEGDYIPVHAIPLPSQIEQSLENIEMIKKNIQEKDQAIVNLKEKISLAKSELAGKSKGAKLRLNTKQASKPAFSSLSSSLEMTIRIYGNQLPSRQHESYKTFRVSPADDCVKLILEAIQKYKLHGDWKEYALFLVVKDQEDICLNPSDRIVEVSQRYLADEVIPNLILQHTRFINSPTTKPLNLDPGTFLAASLGSSAMSRAIGIYDYEAQSREELDVQVGSKFSILARDGEWCVVEKGGQRGSVPTSSIYELEKADKSSAGKTMLCLHDYTRKSRNELSVQRGEKLILKERYHQWYLVQIIETDLEEEECIGLVPFNHIIMIDGAERSSESSDSGRRFSPDEKRSSRFFGDKPQSPMLKSPLQNLDEMASPAEVTSIDSSRDNFKPAVQELERYIKQWESLLNERDDDLNGSAKTLKDTRKLIQYVFSSSSPIQHVILKKPLSGIVAFTLEEVCKKNSSRWLQYANSMMNGSDRKELDSLLYSSIRKNYSSLMKIVNLVLEDNQVAPLVSKPSSLK